MRFTVRETTAQKYRIMEKITNMRFIYIQKNKTYKRFFIQNRQNFLIFFSWIDPKNCVA